MANQDYSLCSAKRRKNGEREGGGRKIKALEMQTHDPWFISEGEGMILCMKDGRMGNGGVLTRTASGACWMWWPIKACVYAMV